MAGETQNYSRGQLSESDSGLEPFTSLNAVTATVNGAILDCRTCRTNVTMACTLSFSVAPSAMSTQLVGSMDKVNWYNLGSAQTSVAASTVVTNVTGTCFRYVQANTTITGGTSPVLTAVIGVAS